MAAAGAPLEKQSFFVRITNSGRWRTVRKTTNGGRCSTVIKHSFYMRITYGGRWRTVRKNTNFT